MIISIYEGGEVTPRSNAYEGWTPVCYVLSSDTEADITRKLEKCFRLPAVRNEVMQRINNIRLNQEAAQARPLGNFLTGKVRYRVAKEKIGMFSTRDVLVLQVQSIDRYYSHETPPTSSRVKEDVVWSDATVETMQLLGELKCQKN